MRTDATKPFGWGSEHWVRWATIDESLRRLGVAPGTDVLDVGCGTGWTTLLLAETGFSAVGIDLVPANLEVARSRAKRWSSSARFEQADMDDFELHKRFGAILVFDSLHHSRRQAAAIECLARHLQPGGWVLFGEPSWLHWISPHARQTTRELGWSERGITARGLRRDCSAAGLGEFCRFFEGTRPYESRVREFARQLARLAGANIAVFPRALIWVAARKPAQL
jgi:SAM-dependent methyltransferase